MLVVVVCVGVGVVVVTSMVILVVVTVVFVIEVVVWVLVEVDVTVDRARVDPRMIDVRFAVTVEVNVGTRPPMIFVEVWVTGLVTVTVVVVGAGASVVLVKKQAAEESIKGLFEAEGDLQQSRGMSISLFPAGAFPAGAAGQEG